jgi:hydrogenase maturation protease
MTGAVHVVCFGNRRRGDDGFGLHLFDRLQREAALPPGVRLFEGGLAGLAALGCFDGCKKAVIVDAVRSGAAPGSLHRLSPTDLASAAAEPSLHSLGVQHLLAALALEQGAPPEVILVCAEVSAIRPFTDQLSPAVARSVEPALQMVLRECTS